jgi:hypothetical protein
MLVNLVAISFNDSYLSIIICSSAQSFLEITIDLVLQVIFFMVQVRLLPACEEAAVSAEVALFLAADGAVFGLELTKMTVQVTVVSVQFAVEACIAAEHFSTAWVTAPGKGRKRGQAGQSKSGQGSGFRC